MLGFRLNMRDTKLSLLDNLSQEVVTYVNFLELELVTGLTPH